MAVIGSSLGGFYARWLSLQTRLPGGAAQPSALSPARPVQAHRRADRCGTNPDEHIFFRAEFIGELKALSDDIGRLTRQHPATPDRQFALISAKGTRCWTGAK